jgi:hypothetical protein
MTFDTTDKIITVERIAVVGLAGYAAGQGGLSYPVAVAIICFALATQIWWALAAGADPRATAMRFGPVAATLVVASVTGFASPVSAGILGLAFVAEGIWLGRVHPTGAQSA